MEFQKGEKNAAGGVGAYRCPAVGMHMVKNRLSLNM